MRIVIIEEQIGVLKTYREVINNSSAHKVIGEFRNHKSAVTELEYLNPDIIITDIAVSGIQGIEYIKEMVPKSKILVVTMAENTKYVFETLRAGATGFITKTYIKQQITEALIKLSNGGAPLSDTISRLVVESFQQKKFDQLTNRENEVLFILSQGKSYSKIAEELYVSINTIKMHVRNIYEKLQVTNRDEIIKLMNRQEKYNLAVA